MPSAPSLLGSITIFGSGRLGPTLSALLALAGVVLGATALARARRRARSGDDAGGRGRSTVALVLGAIGLVLGTVFLAAADAGPGTGNGVVGSWVAMALGPIAIALGVLARTRPGRAGRVTFTPDRPDTPSPA